MRVFMASGLEGSTACFRKFLSAVDHYKADVAILLGDLTGRNVVSIVKRGPSNWEVPVDGKLHQIDSEAGLAEVTASLAARGDYWIEQSSEEFEQTRANPMLVDLLFKSLVRERVEEWLDLADQRLNGNSRVFVAPGCGDWTVIDELLERGGKMKPCDKRIVDLGGYQLVTSSASGPTDWELVREVEDRQYHHDLLELCSGVADTDYAIFCLQADTRSAEKIVKRFQPAVRFQGTVQGGQGGARKQGRTLVVSPRSMLVEDADPTLYGVLVTLEGPEVKDYIFTEA